MPDLSPITDSMHHLAAAAPQTTIDPTHISELSASLSDAIQSMSTVTKEALVVSLLDVMRDAEASLIIISAQSVLATATDRSAQASATRVIAEAFSDIDRNVFLDFYGYNLSRGGNVFFLVFFGLLLLFYAFLSLRSRYWWFNICFICGFIFEVLGYVGRVLSFGDKSNPSFFVLQSLCLTAAPAFFMAGIYFVFAQIVTVYGAQYSVLKPMVYSNFFIAVDVLSLITQAIGGGFSAQTDGNERFSSAGNIVMFTGIMLQIVAMTLFLIFEAMFLSQVYFRDRKNALEQSKYQNKNLTNAFKLLFNIRSARVYKRDYLDCFYDPRYQGIRLRVLFPYFPLAITISTIVIYVRCIYRVVQLKQGFAGYLMGHENFILILDSTLIAICGLIFIPFHPLFVFGSENVLKRVNLKQDQGHSKSRVHELPRETSRDDADSSVLSLTEKRKQREKNMQTLYIS